MLLWFSNIRNCIKALYTRIFTAALREDWEQPSSTSTCLIMSFLQKNIILLLIRMRNSVCINIVQSARYFYNIPNSVYYKLPFCVQKNSFIYTYIFTYTFRKHLGEFGASKGNCACLEEVTLGEENLTFYSISFGTFWILNNFHYYL